MRGPISSREPDWEKKENAEKKTKAAPTFGSVDGSQRSQDSQHTKNLDGLHLFAAQEDGQQADADDDDIEQVETGSHEGVLVENETVRDELDDDLDGEDGGEEVVEVFKELIGRRLGFHWVLGGQHGRRDHDAGQDDVGENRMIADEVTADAEFVGRTEDEEGRGVGDGHAFVGAGAFILFGAFLVLFRFVRLLEPRKGLFLGDGARYLDFELIAWESGKMG